VRIDHGERIAQAVLARYETANWKPGTVGKSTDRLGGLGSTG
jgi:dUTPase